MKPQVALKHFSADLTDYEKGEILGYPQICFIGRHGIKKVESSCLEDHNNGYDDENGDYNIVIGDHIAYRYEVVELLGSGSFGQCVKVIDHK